MHLEEFCKPNIFLEITAVQYEYFKNSLTIVLSLVGRGRERIVRKLDLLHAQEILKLQCELKNSISL